MNHLPITQRDSLSIGAITAKRTKKGRWVSRPVGTNLAWIGETAFTATSRARQYQHSCERALREVAPT